MSDRPEFPEMKARFGVAVEKAREMTAVERLEAAIAKLEAQRDATYDPDSYWVIEDRDGHRWFKALSIIVLDSTWDASIPTAHAELIVTLHRTIAAQLTILRRNKKIGDQREPEFRHALALADAILGADS